MLVKNCTVSISTLTLDMEAGSSLSVRNLIIYHSLVKILFEVEYGDRAPMTLEKGVEGTIKRGWLCNLKF